MNYQFQSEQGGHIFQPHFSRSIVRTLISINAGLFLIRYLMVGQFDMLSLGLSSNPKLWQPITYMFVHGDFFHIFMNMFVLWMFGTEMESIWGGKKFLQYYLMTGIGSGLVWLLFNYNNNYIRTKNSDDVYLTSENIFYYLTPSTTYWGRKPTSSKSSTKNIQRE